MTAIADQRALRGRIFDIERYATHDGPGTRTTLFLKGCPLRCLWCHNPEAESPGPELMYDEQRCIGCLACFAACEAGALWLTDRAGRRIPPEGLPFCRDYAEKIGSRSYQPERCQTASRAELCFAGALEIVGRELTVEEAYAELECDRPFYEHSGGGITISGGEPLAQHLFLLELLALCKAGRLHTALDTTACTRWPILESVLQYTDLVLLDLKVMDPARHREYTGLDNTLILENAQAMAGFIAARATHYSATGPQNTESDPYPRSLAQRHEQNLRATAAFVRGKLGGAVRRVELLGYHQLGGAKLRRLRRESQLPGIEPPSRMRLAELAGLFREELKSTGIRVEAR